MTLTYNYVLFHHPCNDGFLSLVLLREAGILDSNCYIRGAAPDLNILPPNISGKNVIIVDLNLKKKIIMDIIGVSKSVLFIDHHINKDDVHKISHKNFASIYDPRKSACMIIWLKYFKNKKTPSLIKYIDDNDRMANQYNETSVFIAAYEVHFNTENVSTREKIIEKMDKVASLLKNNKDVEKLLVVGKHYSLYKYAITKKSLNNFEHLKLIGPNNVVLDLIVSNIGGFCSRLVASQFQMFDSCDLSITWYYHVGVKGIVCICRSKNNTITWLLQMYDAEGQPRAGTFKCTGVSNIYDWFNAHNRKMRQR